MKQLSKKDTGKLLMVFGIFLLIAGVFGMYMWLSGSDSNAWFSGIVMLFSGAFFIVVAYNNNK
ncbi:hypothetical protein COW99_03530 [Candidatus Roizmanbacteria bacterium CG22_combo_CG10-13_8_21_14_all_38_20]|uniref:Uncharacterized protein n=1 Tax=Candidatus Roizmanbacteria bacterium CG22_combo_CG10-13_8_21_14_all_38_20 TaxID=1974862 RepID=A0A2H0BV63_9BACT|nr:hypothetical protein [Candidatus Microgenomates bacterium]PIP61572.1 MAG: hypothetical protein COW99_03530 [Candidatus Roizmanbacteria bacterium CG22_combo_CG10-13_8_21_14_all_38_20]PJC31526.1 MAG: hypothetical protein CO050_02995 [Candidatus Roizmanbacteria bacterium CG_4_9_14_0_2_um_filter_38_17]